MAVNGVDWDALNLFLSDHPDAYSSLERDKYGVRYLVLTANAAKPVDEESTQEAPVAESKEEEEATDKKAVEETSESDYDEKGYISSNVSEDCSKEDEVEVFKIEIKDTVHEEAVVNARTVLISSFVGALTSTLLSYCAC